MCFFLVITNYRFVYLELLQIELSIYIPKYILIFMDMITNNLRTDKKMSVWQQTK